MAGNLTLKKAFGSRVIGPDDPRIPGLDQPVEEGAQVELGSAALEVLETPGHGSSDISFYLKSVSEEHPGAVWTGDALFVGGCGRLFECNPQTMWATLRKLRDLPDTTHLYCGHEFTEENYRFAISIEPGNLVVRERLEEVRKLLRMGEYTVPSTVALEKATNVFFRSDTQAVQDALGLSDASPVKVFAELRRKKDFF